MVRPSHDQPESVTGGGCPSVAFCVAVDHTGNALIDNAGRWGAPKLIDGFLGT